MAEESGQYEINESDMEDLAGKLEVFAKDLPGNERAALSAVIALASQHLDAQEDDGDDVSGYQFGKGLQLDNGGLFANSFRRSMNRFAPSAFSRPGRTGNAGMAGTNCIE